MSGRRATERRMSWWVTRPYQTGRRPIRTGGLAILLAYSASIATSGCGPIVPDPRVPLPVPLPAVEGARPSVGSGIFVGALFGDGFWGPERERAELTGTSLGFGFADRIEVGFDEYVSNRTIDDANGVPHRGATAETVRAKVVVKESADGAWAFGLVAAYSTAARTVSNVQDESASSLDLALPVEFETLSNPAPGRRIGLYGGPRFILKSFEDRLATAEQQSKDSGMAWGALLGLRSRIGWLHLAAEGSVMRSPRLQAGAYGSEDGWMFIPALTAKLVVPIGEGN